MTDTGGCARFDAGQQTCHWKCGSQCAHPAPNTTESHTFQSVLRRYLNRRPLFRGAAAAGMAATALPHLADSTPAVAQSAPQAGAHLYQEILLNNEDPIIVPPGYAQSVLIRWGDPLFDDSRPFNPDNQTGETQARQFGYNNDFIGFLPLPGSDSRALLSVNHEYTNPELMFPGYDDKSPTKAQVDAELAAHGQTVVEIARSGSQGQWTYVVGSRYNHRITGTTPMLLTGPAAGHAWLQISEDPTGARVLGMLNNCAAGKTPWGTVLTAEENFNQYFANVDKVPMTDPRRAVHARYGMPSGASERKWENHYKRFDMAQEPNEPFRFGWMVEFDPYDPASMPKKRTALGRFKHEAATFIVGPDGRVGVHMGDDERFDSIYTFVRAGRMSAGGAAANADLLDSGTLYAAMFNDDGTGEWIALVHGENGLTPANGFMSQADIVIRTRQAGDQIKATQMDRPEDIEFNPVNKRLYVALTNNTRRTPGQVNKANPRANNRDGHIIEMWEEGDNPTALRFRWGVFMIAGLPSSDESTYFAGYDKREVQPISSPDNLLVDKAGNLWVFRDGQPGTIRANDTVYSVPTAGPERGHLRSFLSAVPGAETASGDLSADETALFVSIQHPGEGGTLERPVSRWPDGTDMPRPSVVVAWKARVSGEKRSGHRPWEEPSPSPHSTMRPSPRASSTCSAASAVSKP